uniref:Polyketide synthase n=1 Tax=Pyxidicoccus sp. MCy9557 TaxID=2012863 RepID=A0A1Z2TJM0_9BACT|nr:polyketide synthase [Pyxidicoccus sp. MCy9557]
MARESIAIIGMACRFPGARDAGAFWNNLTAGVCSVQELPRERWATQDRQGPRLWCGLVEHFDMFDAAAFGISPVEADNMDPQQRLVLEETWHCFEDAAVPLARLRARKTGVFVGAMGMDYLQELAQPGVAANRYAATGGYACIVANRVSYVFGLRGPSMAIDAACAASLAALHQAKQALLSGECDYALVGGVMLNTHPWKLGAFEQARLLSPEGRSKTYDVDADGYAPGEGVGLVLLQRLGDAVSERNRVHAVLRGTAVNHNGHGPGLTAPSVEALRDVALAASEDAGFGLDTVSYMEAHGTGTALGDPIEFEALTRAFRAHTPERGFCRIGSVKPNIGHLEPASGMAGLIKLLLMLKHQRVAPCIDVRTPNPLVDFDSSPFQLARAAIPWRGVREDVPPRAGLMGFGFGGLNAFVLVEAFTPEPARREATGQGPHVFVLSANSASSLTALAEAWTAHAASEGFEKASLEDVCGTLARGRQALPYRLGAIVEDRDGVRRWLAQVPRGAERTRARPWMLRLGDIERGQGAELGKRVPAEGYLHRLVKRAKQTAALRTAEGAFVASCMYASGLIEVGVAPERVTGLGEGLWPALVTSGMVRLPSALKVLRGQLRPEELVLARPSIPFLDPVGGGLWMRYSVDAEYLRELVTRARAAVESLEGWVEGARLLIRKQHTFRKTVAEWAPALGGHHTGLMALLEGTGPVRESGERLLFSLLCVVFMRSLQQKWKLDSALERLDPTVRELLALVASEVIPRGELAELLAAERPDFERIASVAHARQRRLPSGAECPLLESRSERLHEAGDFAAWLKSARAMRATPAVDEGLACLDVGELDVDVAADVTALPARARTLEDSFWETALRLWLQGVEVRWEERYPDGSYEKVALPLYPFSRRRHWIGDSPMRAERDGRTQAREQAPRQEQARLQEQAPVQGAIVVAEQSARTERIMVSNKSNEGTAARAPSAAEARAFRRKVEAELLAAGTEILRVDAGVLGAHDSLGNVGFDSVGLKDFATRIERQFGVGFNPSLFFAHPTVASIAEYLWERQGERLARTPAPVEAAPEREVSVPPSAPREQPAPVPSPPDASRAPPALVSSTPPRTTDARPGEGAHARTEAGVERGVAIIGMAGALPGARDLDELWRRLRAGEDLISEAPLERWDWRAWGEDDGAFLKWGGFAPGFDCFDAPFFNVAPREAELMDPQQRMLLQTTWKALEDAGHPPATLSGRNVGVFMGVWAQDYHHRLSHHGLVHAQVETGNALTMLGNRISYVFNLRGPSEVFNAACASSLVALHRAAQALRSGECELAIVGGVNALVLPEVTRNLAQVGILSRNGRCRTFDASANGYVRGEGAVVVVLKRLEQAEADADFIHAVVRGSRQNHGGRASSLTAPNPKAQAELIFGALDEAGFEPETVTYIEAHGTGTELGDPVEVDGLKSAFEQLARKRQRALEGTQFCGLGSIKSNVGHLESAAGLAGLVKVVLAMRHGELPASLHVQKLNPLIRLEGSPFYVVRRTQPWARVEDAEGRPVPRRAGVSSFGFGGSNAHVALEEYVGQRASVDAQATGPWLFPLSARNAERLRERAAQLVSFLEERLGGATERGLPVARDAEGAVLAAASTVLGIPIEALRKEEDWGAGALGAAGVSELLGRLNEAYDVQLSPSVLSGSLSLKPLVRELEARGVVGPSSEARSPVAGPRLADVAYTLQVGREEMEERLAVVAGSETELLQQLRGFLAGKREGESLFTGSVRGTSRRNELLSGDEDAEVMLRSWARKGKLPRLAELWVGGADIDWAVLPQAEGCRRVPLPTYPFAQVRYWLAAPEAPRALASSPHRQTDAASEAAGTWKAPAPAPRRQADVVPDATGTWTAPAPMARHQADPVREATPAWTAPASVAFEPLAPPSVEVRPVEVAPPARMPPPPAPKARKPAPAPVAPPPLDLGRAVEDVIVSHVAEVLGMQPETVSREQQFAEYGINSIMGTGLVSTLNRALGVSLRTTTLFDYPNVTSLRDYLLKNHGDALARALAPKAPAEPEPEPEALEVDEPPAEVQPLATDTRPASAPVTGDIAVIGIAGRFPGAPDTRAFWKLLEEGRSAVTEVPPNRWDWTRFYDPDPMKRDKTHCKWGGFLDDIDRFDALFFGISGREAELSEPQQRVFLQECWNALEDAGYATDAASQMRVGVFAGVHAGDYALNLQQAGVDLEAQALTGNDCSVAPARLSYFLNLKGPCISVDTACSSSLTAIHMARVSLLAGDCDMAVAGGVFIRVTPTFYIKTSNAGMLSPRGQCRTFDDGADGFVPGEAAAAVVLKPLEAALRDGDHIYGVIKGSGVNQDGKTNGLTAPSALAQETLERTVYEQAGIHPETISYVEAHGTGTKLGDPIEVQALTNAFRAFTDKTRYCGLGSVKTNIGHTAVSAGVTSLIKVLLSMKHGMLPASLGLERENEHIDFHNSPFYVVRRLQPWTPPGGVPRRAAISSFGFSGTNAHLVVEEAPRVTRATSELPDPSVLIVLSGRTEEALLRRMRDLAHWLDEEGAGCSLEDVSFTLLVGRRHFPVRAAFVVRDVAELRERLREAACEPATARGAWFAEARSPASGASVEDSRWSGLRDSRSRFEERLRGLATAYLKGERVTWTRLFEGRGRRRVPLPTYPFARVRYWIGDHLRDTHPLLGTVEPGGTPRTGLTFTRRLPEETWVLNEHRVRGHAILPGVAYLELAHEAARQSLGAGSYALRRVVWLQKLAVEGAGREVRLVLRQEEGTRLDFVVQSQGAEAGTWTTHAQGELHTVSPAEPARVALDEVRARCTRLIDASELYRRYDELSLRYGESFRSVREVRCGPTEALSRLEASGKQRAEWGQWGLPPGMLDGAMQTVLGVVEQPPGTTVMPFAVEEVVVRRAVPAQAYAYIKQLGRLRYDVALVDGAGEVCVELKEVTLREWRDTKPAVSAKAENPARGEGRAPAVMANTVGTAKDAMPREQRQAVTSAAATPQAKAEVAMKALGTAQTAKAEGMLYVPRWDAKAVESERREWSRQGVGPRVVVVGSEQSAELEEALARAHAAEGVVRVRLAERTRRQAEGQWEWDSRDAEGAGQWLAEAAGLKRLYFLGAMDGGAEPAVEEEGALEASQQRGVVALFRLVKVLSERGLVLTPLEVRVVTANAHRVVEGERPRPWGASVQGFVKAVANEYPALRVSYVDVAGEELKGEEVVRGVVEEPAQGRGADVALRQGRRYERRLLPVEKLHAGRVPLRQRGVYLLVGGGGGIGLEVASWLARGYQARLVVVGRRAAEGELARRLKGLEEAGAEVLYVQADVTQPGQAKRAVQQARERFGVVHGVFHLAVVIQDGLLERMTESMLKTVLDSKVKASVTVHAALEGEPLECAVFFSSAQSFLGNVGASNYAAGCTFQDAYAAWLREEKGVPTYVLNWGSWGTLGLVADVRLRNTLHQQGILPMDAAEGMEAMEAVLRGGAPQMMTFKGTLPMLERLGVDFSRQVEVYAPGAEGLETLATREASTWEQRAGGRLAGVEEAYVEVEAWGRALLLDAMKKLGAVERVGEAWEEGARARQVGVVETHGRLWSALMGVLERAGYVRRSGSNVTVLEKAGQGPGTAQLEDWKQRLLAKHPGFRPHVNLMWATLSRAPEVLRGELLATEVLFPEASSALVEAYYRGHPLADYFNRLMAIACRWFVEERRRAGTREPLRILEVGAGTGSTTAFVLDALSQAGPVEYVFTDVSLGFVNSARKEFASRYPFATFQVLDVEKRPESQGVQPGSFDLVFGTNVLHATKNIRKTLEHVKVLLKHHGWLAISELTDVPEYTTMTFGFLKGWWLFEDGESRLPGGPLLSPAHWRTALAETGFRPLVACGQPGGLGHGLSQHIIIGVSDGCIGGARAGAPVAPVRQAAPAARPMPEPPRPVAPPAPERPAPSARPAGSSEQQRRLIEAELVQVAASVLRIPGTDILPELPFSELGVDSILAVDLSDKINRAMSVGLRSTDLFNYATVRQLARHILDLRAHEPVQAAPSSPPATAAPPPAEAGDEDAMMSLLASLESGALSIDEVDAFLEKHHG